MQRHAWNTDFEWADHAGPFQALDSEQVKQFDELGYVVVEDILGRDQLEVILAETDRFEAEMDTMLQRVEGGRFSIAETGAITFSTHLVPRSEVLRDLSRHSRLVGICADLIGPDVRLYWDQAVYKKPEKPRRFPWHQDNGYAFVEPQQYLTCWLALTDATTDNGCPQVAVGLHRLGTLAHTFVDPLGFECFSDPDDVAIAEVPAGGAVVFSSLTPHLTGPNLTPDVRKAYILQYAPDGARKAEGNPAAGPPSGFTPCSAADRQYEVLRAGQAI